MSALADRTERVVLSLEDNFTSGMARAAAATALFDKTLAELDGSSTKASKSTGDLGDDNGGIAKTGRQARNASNDLNRYTGRLNLLLSAAAVLGPSLVPITAGLIPALSGVAAGFGAAAGAAGVAALAFSGVGDAVKAIDAYKLEPTTENLQKMTQALRDLGPARAEFATFIDGLEPELRALQDAAGSGLFPGLEQGINELMPLLPQVQQLIGGISDELGHLSAEAGNGLANDASFQRFFHYLETDAAPTMDDFAKATGHVASGLASLMVDLAPLTRDFSGGLEHAAKSFDDWAAGLNQTQGFRDFLAYVEQSGPKVIDLLEALGNASLGIIHAMQPVGAVVLPVLTALANIIGVIGKSPLGPMFYTAVAGMLVFNRMAALSTTAVGRLATAWAAVGASAEAATAAQVTAGKAGAVAPVAAAGGAGFLSKAGGFLRTGVGIATGVGALTYLGQAGLAKLTHANLDASKLDQSDQINKLGRDLSLTTANLGIGQHVVDFLPGKSGVQIARDNVAKADLQLQGMVDAGQTSDAAALFSKFTASAKAHGASVADAAKQFPNYIAAVKNAAKANKDDSASTDTSTMSMRQLRQALVDGTIGLKQYAEAQEALHQRALSNFDAVTSFGQAVQNAAKQAASGAKGFNQFTAAGAANRQAISGLIESYNAQPKAVKNSVKGYEQMRGKLVQLLHQMGATKDQIDAFTRDIDKPRRLVLGFQDQGTLDEIAKIKNALATIPRKVSTDYYVNQITGYNKRQAMDQERHAFGGLIVGPGGPRDDLIPALLSNREYVMPADAVEHYGVGFMDTIRARRLADGGLAGGPFDYSIDSTTIPPSKASAAATKAAAKKAAADAKAAAAAAKAAHDLGMLSITLKPLNGKDFKDLRHGLHDLLNESKKHHDVLRLTGVSLRDLNKASHLLGKSLASTKSALSSARSNRDSLQSTITSGLMPDLFTNATTSTNPFTPGATKTGFSPDSINAQIGAATAKAQVFGNLLTAAEAKGLTGSALNVVLSQGGFDALQMFANAPASTVQAFTKGYIGLENVVSGPNGVATAGANAVYGPQIAELKEIKKALNKNSKAIEQAIKDKTKLDDHSRAKHSKDNAAATSAGVNGAAVKGAKSSPHRGRK